MLVEFAGWDLENYQLVRAFSAERIQTHEASENLVTLKNDNPKMVERMIYYLYHLGYLPTAPISLKDLVKDIHPDDWCSGCIELNMLERSRERKVEECPCISEVMDLLHGKNPGTHCGDDSDSTLATHASMYAMDDKYGIAELKDLAKGRLEAALTKHGLNLTFPRDVAISIVFCMTPDSDSALRVLVARYFAQHEYMLGLEPIQRALEEHNGLALAVLKALHPNHLQSDSNSIPYRQDQLQDANKLYRLKRALS
ncbi:uncharacterized protein BDZ99DRAFT_522868 [Mytilinidion resinicola]|uniref:BTB domain-containing protein n=1 Tax=Mytilinidion resinicola TaxID=574789 RepID=A0A6A6YET8_9PEZI|nr:uncharacterized protein BDZ99DRAFT_522868 [Mytilinidion resinicola]KAF2807250.1 hypothetical protein BDZ99DRAFT_522868 [Mytilinidion resinicola]